MRDNIFTDKVLKNLKKVTGSNFAALHEPNFSGNEKKYINEAIDSTFVSSVGKFVNKFEELLVNFTGAKFAIATVNGTAALHISLLVAGVKENDEVLVPSFTFVATANAINYCRADCHFIDVNYNDLGIDVPKLREYLSKISIQINSECFNKSTKKRIKAIVPMHSFGHSVDIDSLLLLCKDFNLTLVEDCAESLGSYYKGKHTGTYGLVSALSFNGNKIITTGGGGAILTNNEEIAALAKHLTTTAKVVHAWEYIHDMVGYNYRMPNLNAALGCAQLEQLDKIINNKRTLYNIYVDALSGIEGLSVFEEPANTKSNYWLQALVLENDYKKYQRDLLIALNSNNIMCRPPWMPISLLKPYKNYISTNLDVTIDLYERIINIPSSPTLATNHV